MVKVAGFTAEMPDGDLIRVEKITAGRDIHTYAPVIERIISESYSAQFEPNVVPVGAVREYLADAGNETYVARRESQMRRRIQKGSVYYGAWVEDGDMSYGAFVGLAKSTPSRPRWRKSLYPVANKDPQANCFINDVVVLPRFQRRGVGSALLLAATSGYVDDKKGVLNAFAGNTGVDKWFECLSFRSREDICIDQFEIGPHKIPQIRMEATALRGVAAVLLRKRPWLAGAKSLDS